MCEMGTDLLGGRSQRSFRYISSLQRRKNTTLTSLTQNSNSSKKVKCSSNRNIEKHAVTELWYRTEFCYWVLVLGSVTGLVQAGFSLTFLHYPSRWLGTGGKAEQTASCHSADIASQFAATGIRDEDEEEDK